MQYRLERSERRSGTAGAVSAGHPLAAETGVRILREGGSAVDAAIAAQAVICTVMPQAAGLGGDLLALVRSGGITRAFNGVGRSAAAAPRAYETDGGSSVTVPGLVDAWTELHRRHGRLPLPRVLADAVSLADHGVEIDDGLFRAAQEQAHRIREYGGASWRLLSLGVGERWAQPELSDLLTGIANVGGDAFYAGAAASGIERAVAAHGGTLTAQDLAEHRTGVGDPVRTSWGVSTLEVQPPPTQGVLLAMAAQWLDRADGITSENLQHALVEATEAAFAHRDDASSGSALLAAPLDVDLHRAQRRGGPRSYLHTAGVAAADADGLVISSLVSVFDDFGSGVFVPELGIVMNNRAAGFTSGANRPSPGRYPVHTLAPALLTSPNGDVLALATPGADGQIQTLLQIIARMRFTGESLAEALTAPRWRSQDGRLLVEADHPHRADLERRGHEVSPIPPGDDLFGAAVAAGIAGRTPFAASDWRRLVTTGAA